jgi:hypothetical protein
LVINNQSIYISRGTGEKKLDVIVMNTNDVIPLVKKVQEWLEDNKARTAQVEIQAVAQATSLKAEDVKVALMDLGYSNKEGVWTATENPAKDIEAAFKADREEQRRAIAPQKEVADAINEEAKNGEIIIKNIFDKVRVNNPGMTEKHLIEIAEGLGYRVVFVKDEAMLIKKEVGGIDFNPQFLDLKIKRNERGVPLPVPMQDIRHIRIDGLYPVIINVSPATLQSFPLLMGELKQEESEDRKSVV